MQSQSIPPSSRSDANMNAPGNVHAYAPSQCALASNVFTLARSSLISASKTSSRCVEWCISFARTSSNSRWRLLTTASCKKQAPTAASSSSWAMIASAARRHASASSYMSAFVPFPNIPSFTLFFATSASRGCSTYAPAMMSYSSARCLCVVCADNGSARVMSSPIFPASLLESHRAIAEYAAVLGQYETSMTALRNELAWLRGANDEARAEWQAAMAARDAAVTRAEAAEGMLRSLARAARLCERTLAVSPSDSITLQVVYEFGSLSLMKLAGVPAAPHPRLLLERIVKKQLTPAAHHEGDPESGIDDEDATIVAAGVVVAAMRDDYCGHEAAAHSRQRDDERHRERVTGGASGTGAGARR